MIPSPLDRRKFLKGVGVAAGASVLGSAYSAAPLLAPARKAKRVIVVAFAGGVRSRETIGTPDNVPNLMGMAAEGVMYTRSRTSNLGHFGASLSIFTGISEARGIRENSRGPDPTLFEYVRKDLGISADRVWISTSGGAQQTNYSHSTHPDYGAKLGANTLDGDGLFNQEFRDLIAGFGKPAELEGNESRLLERLRRSVGTGLGEARIPVEESSGRIEEYIMQELSRGTADIRGVNAGDAKALRVARNLTSLFRPTLLGVVLTRADVAHGSYNGYVDVIRRNDAALGELFNAVRGDPELRDSTAIFVLPEFGRDADLNERRGLDHGDGSDDLRYVSTICWGPDFRRGQVVREEVRTIDVCPTICDLLGSKARFAKGKRLLRLYA